MGLGRANIGNYPSDLNYYDVSVLILLLYYYYEPR